MKTLLAAAAAATILAPALAGQAAPATPSPGTSPFLPDTVLSPPGGPRIVLLTAPGEDVAALRLAVPLREGPAEAGAGWLLRELALERMRTLARPVGARVSASRTPWGVAYSVVGAAADFEFLAYLLRQAVASPEVDGAGFSDAVLRLREESARALETPQGRVASDLRGQVAPGALPPVGTPGSATAMDGARVREVWRRTHQASRMTLVVSAPVIPEVVLAATRGMGAPEDAAAGPLEAPSPPEPRRVSPQSLRAWYGEAWSAGAAEDPHGPVAAILVAGELRGRVSGFEASVELWELPDRWVLAVLGAAYGREAASMRRTVSGVVAATRASLDPREVAEAVSRVQGDLLTRSRTPAGLVALVGRAAEATGDPRAAALHLEALGAVDAASTGRYLDGVLAGAPVKAEVRP